MIYPLIAAVMGLLIGVTIGYLVTYRYKAQYEIARRQLANLRGENYRGEVATIPLKANSAVLDVPPAVAAELQQLRRQCARLEQDLAEAKQVQHQSSEPIAEEAAAAAEVTGTEQWQLAQLHREQIAMQLSLDEHQLQVKDLSAELASVRSQSELDLLQLRKILGEHEATIASLEREKSSLQDRLRSIDSRAGDD